MIYGFGSESSNNITRWPIATYGWTNYTYPSLVTHTCSTTIALLLGECSSPAPRWRRAEFAGKEFSRARRGRRGCIGAPVHRGRNGSACWRSGVAEATGESSSPAPSFWPLLVEAVRHVRMDGRSPRSISKKPLHANDAQAQLHELQNANWACFYASHRCQVGPISWSSSPSFKHANY